MSSASCEDWGEARRSFLEKRRPRAEGCSRNHSCGSELDRTATCVARASWVLMHAGLGKRVMFGSDQIYWPEAIGMAVEGVDSGHLPDAFGKQDIFDGNASRFFRLEQVGVATSCGPSTNRSMAASVQDVPLTGAASLMAAEMGRCEIGS